jgi:hypothetical protein
VSPIRLALLTGILMANTAYAGDGLGRLFLTPEQRRALDELRDPNGPRPGADLGSSALPGGTPTDRNVLLNGVVSRSHGPDVVWVNGTRAGAEGNGLVQLRSGPDQRNRVTLEDAKRATVRLKPGQFWDPATGRVADCLG